MPFLQEQFGEIEPYCYYYHWTACGVDERLARAGRIREAENIYVEDLTALPVLHE